MSADTAEIPERRHDDIILALPDSATGEDADLFRSARDLDAWARLTMATNLPPRTRHIALVVQYYAVLYGFCPGDTEQLGLDSALPRRRVAEALAILADAGWITRRLRSA